MGRPKEKSPGGVPAEACTTWNEVGLLLPLEWWVVTLLSKSTAVEPC